MKFTCKFAAFAIFIASFGYTYPVPAFDFKRLPGAVDFSQALQDELAEKWRTMPPDYQPRTQHLRNDGVPLYVNRLLLQPSPYLKQHAHNPVDWRYWGEEAFSIARELDRPVLISIGYSACHWCHVMEEESYDNEEIARILNENFVVVKVDRETHPDVDELYMLAVELMGGSGGWPLHVFVTPEGKPFVGATYLPAQEFKAALQEVDGVWRTQRAQVERLAQRVTADVQNFGLDSDSNVEIGQPEIERLIARLSEVRKSMDEFSTPASSFPSEPEMFLLLDAAMRYSHREALSLVEDRLTRMALGGIRDHVGGGFHRYSIDNEWLVPHFEKMLYNQAHIARAYLYAFQITGKPLFRRVAVQILDYVLRDMIGSNGEFYSATDADSEGEEGEFFLWTPDEIREALGDNADFAIELYGVTQEGNFEGKNILFLDSPPEQLAHESVQDLEIYLNRIAAIQEKMRVFRDRREKPFLDTKVITAWNSMMIATLAEAGRILDDARYHEAAERAAEFLWANNRRDDEVLFRIYIEGQGGTVAKLRDYAYLIQAMLSLYDESGNRLWLKRSEELAQEMVDQFWDRDDGGFFSVSADDSKNLVVRTKNRFDHALPSGNSVAAQVLSRLYSRTGKLIYAQRIEQLFETFGAEISQIPSSYSYALLALEEYRGGQMGEREYAASGHAVVSVSASGDSTDRIRAVVILQLDDGWHVQSNRPLEENLIATTVSTLDDSWTVDEANYPAAELLQTSFQSAPLSVWSGKISIPVELKKISGQNTGPVTVVVQLQACDDNLCLLPEKLKLEIPLTAVTG